MKEHRRGSRRKPSIPKLEHDEAVLYLVDYHFGRLNPQMNSAVEAHIRECPICQRQGLRHAATEKRVAVRRLTHVRATRPLISIRGRTLMLFFTVLFLIQLIIIGLARGDLPIAAIVSALRPHPAAHRATPTPIPTPAILNPILTYDAPSTNATALGLRPDGATLAAAQSHAPNYVITLWSTATGQQSASLIWPGSVRPGVLAWSPDGKSLAAADGQIIVAWSLPNTTPSFQLNLPTITPAYRVYDISAGAAIQRLDPSTVFAHGEQLRWDATGQLNPAPASAGAASVTASGSPQVSLWQSNGSHLYLANGALTLGLSAADLSQRRALLVWAPNNRDLFWGQPSQALPVVTATTSTATATATKATTPASTTATPTLATTPAASAAFTAVTPYPIISTIAAHITQRNQGDALIWFAPNGGAIAYCDRGAPGATLSIYDLSSNQVIAQLPAACDQMSLATLIWNPSATAPIRLIIALPDRPLATYAPPPLATPVPTVGHTPSPTQATGATPTHS